MPRGPALDAADWKKFEQSGRNTIALATILGWRVHWNSNNKNTAVLTSQTGTKKIVVPTTNINANRYRSWITQILTSSDSAQVVRLAQGTLDLRTQPEAVQRVVATMGTALSQFAMRYAEQRSLIDAASKETPVLTQKVIESVGPPVTAVQDPLPVSPSVTDRHTVGVVKVEPLMATRASDGRSKGRTYESRTTEVVTLSDGSAFFRCRFCEYVSVNKLSVRAHSNTAHRGLGTPEHVAEQRKAEQPSAPAAMPSDPRRLHGIELLTHEVREGFKDRQQARDVAVHLLNLSFEERAKIAHIILNGKDVETLRTLAEESIAEANEARDAAVAKAAAAEAKATAIESDLTALREMIQGIGASR